MKRRYLTPRHAFSVLFPMVVEAVMIAIYLDKPATWRAIIAWVCAPLLVVLSGYLWGLSSVISETCEKYGLETGWMDRRL